VIAASAVLLITAGLRLPYIMRIPFLNCDEMFLSAAAARMLDGRLLYREVVSDKPPLLHLVYLAVFRAGGLYNQRAVQLLGWVWTLLTTGALFLTARRGFGAAVGLMSALIYAVFSTTFDPSDMIAANRELFMVLPLAAGAYFLLRGETGGRPWPYLLCGGLSGVAALFKQPAAANFLAIGVYLLWRTLFLRESPARTAVKAGWVAAGGAVPLALCGLYFHLRGTLPDLVRWVFVYGWSYTVAVPWRQGTNVFGSMLRDLVAPNFLFWGLALASLARRSPRVELPATVFIWIWALCSLAGAAAGRRPYPHYYIQAIPAFSVLAGLGLSVLRERVFHGGRSVVVRSLAAGLLILGVLVPIVYAHAIRAQSAAGMYLPGSYRLWGPRQAVCRDEPIADYVRSTTPSGAKILVWGFAPGIYVLSRRVCGSRFITAEFPVGAVPGGPGSARIDMPGAADLLLADLDRERPLLIVDTSGNERYEYGNFPLGRFPTLWAYVSEHYRLAATVDLCPIYRRREGESDLPPLLELSPCLGT